LKFNNYFYHFR